MNGNPKIEKMSYDELLALQSKRLKAAARYACENVPLYRKRFKEAGIDCDGIKGLEDLHRLPFTYKTDLRDNYPFGMCAVPLNRLVRIHASSGTTGKPTVVTYTKQDLDTWTELMARSYRVCGVGPNDIVQNAYGYGLFTGGLGFHQGAEAIGAAILPTGGGNTLRQLALMKDMQTTVLACTPSYAVYMGEAALREGYEPKRDFNLKVGMFGAEPWSEEARRNIEDYLGLRAHDVYGLSEIYGPGVGIECKHQCGLHVWGDHVIIEVLDPQTGEPLEPGEFGELAFTTLTREALPMLRYRTRDLGKISVEPCECGLNTVRITEIRGRSDDMLIIGGVNVFPSQVESVLFSVPGIGEQYELVVDRHKTLTRLHVRVEVAKDAAKTEKELDALHKEAASRLQSVLGINAMLELEKPGTLPRYEGKAKRVIYID